MIGTWALLLLVLVTTTNVLADETDYNVVNEDGSFKFSLSNDDEGGHYHSASGTNQQVVRGRYGSRSPITNQLEQITYTAGPRGFRARGANIHRNMDLSQVPRGPQGSADDPLADPSEDPSYGFRFRTANYQRREDADRNGRVNGLYSYLDDIGERHSVRYAAGAGTGYQVTNAVPDTPNLVKYNAPLYKTNRPARGKVSYERGPGGQYKFIASAPDQRRSELTGADGITRGSYSYLDDKGVQRTVEYIAGAGIGYKIVQSSTGPGSHLKPRPAIPAFGVTSSNDISDAEGTGFRKESGSSFGGGSAAAGGSGSSSFGAGAGSRQNIGGFRGGSGSSSSGEGGFGSGGGSSYGSAGCSGGSRAATSSSDCGGNWDKSGSSSSGRGGSSESHRGSASGGFGSGQSSGSSASRFGAGGSSESSRGSATGFGKSGSSQSSSSGRFGGGSSETYGSSSHGGGGSGEYSSAERNQLSGGGGSSGSSSFGSAASSKTGSTGGGFSSRGGSTPVRGGSSGSGGAQTSYVTSNDASLAIDRNRDWTTSGRDSTIVKNVGKWYVGLPPGTAVRAHVQNIDLLPIGGRPLSPSEALRKDVQRSRNFDSYDD